MAEHFSPYRPEPHPDSDLGPHGPWRVMIGDVCHDVYADGTTAIHVAGLLNELDGAMQAIADLKRRLAESEGRVERLREQIQMTRARVAAVMGDCETVLHADRWSELKATCSQMDRALAATPPENKT